jgi:death-on-curing protein
VAALAWLRKDVLLSLHTRLLNEHGGAGGLCDEGALDAALARPRQVLAYDPKADLFVLAAAYGVAISRNHPFVDGNKRVAALATILFLELNGRSFSAPEPEVVGMFRLLAAREMEEPAFAAWLKQHCRRARTRREK